MWNVAYGLAGCLWAIHLAKSISRPVLDPYVSLLTEAEVSSPGLLAGSDGIALVLKALGHDSVAGGFWTTSLEGVTAVGLRSGLAGIGLAQLMAGIEGTVVEDVSDELRRLLDDESVTPPAGTNEGWSGAAILWARLFRETQKPSYVDCAKAAIDRDLARCKVTQTGTLEYDEGWRTLPYLGIGSCGVGLAIGELWLATGEAHFAEEDQLILRAASYGQYSQSGMDSGVAGIMAYLLRRRDYDPSDRLNDVIDRHLRSLRMHSLSYRGDVVFRGNQGLRLSMDYATGSAGVLAALSAVDGHGTGLPFI